MVLSSATAGAANHGSTSPATQNPTAATITRPPVPPHTESTTTTRMPTTAPAVPASSTGRVNHRSACVGGGSAGGFASVG